ncbi:MAG: SPASM domain-containing protein [Deltaproteobacteria bacterium]|nr:SPASM domain-containing protein [Deltaproteobacteria bacterium]
MKTIIFKATDLCNSNCIYCHAIRKDPHAIKTMPLDILEQFFARANAFLMEQPEETLKIIWHGGEPLMLGPDYFSRALEFKEDLCRDTGSRISFDMQSNLTLFSREYVDVFQRMGIRTIGTSFELLPGVRGRGGKEGSDIYNRQFIRAVSLLEHEGLSWGIIYVVTRPSLKNPLELFRTLTNFVPSSSVMFNPVTFHKAGPDQIAISPEEFVDFLGEIFPEWWCKRERYQGVDPFHSLTDNLMKGGESLLCVDSGRCADTHLCVSPDGMAWQCGRSADWDLMRYGSIVDLSLKEILEHPDKEMLRTRPRVLKDGECSGCRFWDICHGGCPLDALAETGSIMHKSPWCGTKKGFIEKYFEPITGFRYPSPVLQYGEPGTGHNEATAVPSVASCPPGCSTGIRTQDDAPWIGPVECMDDALMVSGILNQLVEENPSKRFNLVFRASYREIFQGHPAISEFGLPPQGTTPIRLSCRSNGDIPSPSTSAYQLLAGLLGLKTPAAEELFVPWKFEDDPSLLESIPWRKPNILICPFSETPRTRIDIRTWEELAARLIVDGFGVMQLANMRQPHIRGAYSIRGLLDVRRMISFVRHFDLVITSNNMFMHIARLHEIPALVLWGPSDHGFYGYTGHSHLQGKRTCANAGGCIGPLTDGRLSSPCPMGDDHCMNTLKAEAIYQAALEIAGTPTSSGR